MTVQGTPPGGPQRYLGLSPEPNNWEGESVAGLINNLATRSVCASTQAKQPGSLLSNRLLLYPFIRSGCKVPFEREILLPAFRRF